MRPDSATVADNPRAENFCRLSAEESRGAFSNLLQKGFGRESMRSIAILAAAIFAALSVTSAQAAVRITDDPGGLMTQYASRFSMVRQSGEKVVIDGPCLSACTMVLGMLPREQVCVTQNAVLGFHAAWNYNGHGRRVTSAVATQALIDIYPAPIRSWLARRGGLSPTMKFLRGRELAAMYPACR
jgi:hypothetical protein